MILLGVLPKLLTAIRTQTEKKYISFAAYARYHPEAASLNWHTLTPIDRQGWYQQVAFCAIGFFLINMVRYRWKPVQKVLFKTAHRASSSKNLQGSRAANSTGRQPNRHAHCRCTNPINQPSCWVQRLCASPCEASIEMTAELEVEI